MLDALVEDGYRKVLCLKIKRFRDGCVSAGRMRSC